MGPNLHYDHSEDGTSYLGFAHSHCNKRAGAIKGHRAQQAKTGAHTGSSYPIRTT